MDTNTFEFSVEGIGTFQAYKEAPLSTFLSTMNNRAELAKLCGGQVELAKIEATIGQLSGSSDPMEKDIAYRLTLDMMRAKSFLEMKSLIFELPKGIFIDSLTDEQFNKVYEAFESRRGSFRPPTGKDTVSAAPAVEPAERSGAAKV